MKKNKKIITALLTSVVTVSLLPNLVEANENNTEGKHKASLRLIEGDFILETKPILSFGSHKIEKSKKIVTTGFDGNFYVTDARGTQEGWDVTVEATPFKIAEPSTGWVQENDYSLPEGSLILGKIKDLRGVYNERSSIHPTKNDLGVAIDLGSAINVLEANSGQGMGKYEFNFNSNALGLVIDPKTAKIDKINYPNSATVYESTMTWNLISGPTSIDVVNYKMINNIYYTEKIENNIHTVTIHNSALELEGPYYYFNMWHQFTGEYIDLNNINEEDLRIIIGENAFANKNLTSVHLNNVVEIKKNAFANNDISDIGFTILEKIDENAFYGNNNINSVILNDTENTLKNTLNDNKEKYFNNPEVEIIEYQQS